MKKILMLSIFLSSGFLLSQKTKYYLTYEDDKGKGMIDTLGMVLLKSEDFSYVETDEKNDVVIVRNKENKYGVLSPDFKTIIPFEYDYISSSKYKNDRFIYSLQDKYGLISNLNKKVSQTYDYISELDKNRFIIKVNEKYGVIDKNGKMIINPEFESIDNKISDKLIAVEKEGKYGYINTKGRIVIKPKYKYANSFYKGNAIITKNDKKGIINKKEIVLIEPVFDDLWTLDGILFFVKQNGKYGVFNQYLKMTLEPIYDYIDYYRPNDGIYAIEKDGKYGFINEKGELFIDCKYDGASNFSEGLAPVLLNGKWGVINKKGETVIDFQFIGDIESFQNGLAKYHKGPRSRLGYTWKTDGYIKNNGTIFIEPKYEGIQYLFGDKAIEVSKGNKYLIDIRTGEKIFKLRKDDSIYMYSPK